ncbi:MAG: hypothetical protein EBZ77_08345 [Chitinophagia bacterium]|nr:hypothetical protein [Chitinophagia bacterium]
MAGVFFFSAYSKIYSDHAFDGFQWSFIDLGITSQLATGIIARLMIGFEVVLGVFLLAHLFLRQLTYKAIIATLAVFIVYLLLLIVKQGNAGNCGCFGDKLAMTPLQAILKNLGMIAVTVLLMRIYPGKTYQHQDIIAIVVGMVSLTLPFLVNPLNINSAPVKFTKPLDLGILYKFEQKPDVDLMHGKHIVAFMTLSCPHCKKAAYLLQIIHREHPELPVYMVIGGDESMKDSFFKETHAEKVPHFIYYHWGEFITLVGQEGFPAIYWINDGKIEYRSQQTYYQLDPTYMLNWYHNK